MENTPNMSGKNEKSKLNQAVIYLAGSIEFEKSSGTGYRKNFMDKCRERGLKLKFLDPTNKITGLTPDVGVEKDKIDAYRSSGKWSQLRGLMKKIVKQDLRQVDLSDMIVAFIDKRVYTCGTIHEVVTGEDQRKLVLIICEGGKENCPAWLFGIIHYNYIFDTADEAIDYLVKMNNGTIPLDKKLILFRKELDELEV
jgi:hypothetical protein